jgi:hypothetical protein
MATKSMVVTVNHSSNGVAMYGTPFALDQNCTSFKLTANTAQEVVVPNGVNTALITYSTGPSVFVSPIEISLPGGTPVTGACYINKSCMPVKAGDSLWFISASNDYVSVSFFDNASGYSNG